MIVETEEETRVREAAFQEIAIILQALTAWRRAHPGPQALALLQACCDGDSSSESSTVIMGDQP